MCSLHPHSFSKTSLVAQMVKRLPTMRKTQGQSLGQEDPLEKEIATHSSGLPRKSHGQRSVVGYSPWGKESDMAEQRHFTSASPKGECRKSHFTVVETEA